MITVDRPEIGWSTVHPGSKLLDFPRDVECLAEELQLERYSVMVRESSKVLRAE